MCDECIAYQADVRAIEWADCPIPLSHKHTQYRKMDVHFWNNFLCFYPMEGEATEEEIRHLVQRIINIGKRGLLINGDMPAWHKGAHLGRSCSLKERHDKQQNNFCIEVSDFKSLDTIIDLLFEEAGLERYKIPPMGQWR